MTRNKTTFALVALLACSPAYAAEGCQLSIRPTTSGFFLNPTLEKVIVLKATSSDADKPCLLLADDELLQIDDRIIPGGKAKDVMAYWKSLPKGARRTFKVRRAGAVVSIVTQ